LSELKGKEDLDKKGIDEKKMIRVSRTVCHEGFQEIYEHFGNTLGTLWEQRGTLPISSLFYEASGIMVEAKSP
jgi:hypothetical protein